MGGGCCCGRWGRGFGGAPSPAFMGGGDPEVEIWVEEGSWGLGGKG